MLGHTYRTFPDGMTTSVNKLANLERIGCGGFGEVFKATHDDWGIVAYKKLPQQFIKETKAVKQMGREVEILRGLRHRNIISIAGIVFEEGNYGILLEYMMYGGLDNFLSEFPVPLLYKVQLVLEVVLGMNYLHSLDKVIIHGDLKIQNVLVADGYVAKISDFGLSSWKDMSKTSSRSNGVCPGTVTHIPPERWSDINLPRNPMEDVYAYGILLWETFTEKMPFSNAPSGMISAVVQNGQRPDVTQLPEDLPLVIHSLMETSWHQDQSKRKPFKEIKEILERYTAEEAKKIAAARAKLQQQESSSCSSQTSLEYDGSLIAPSLSGPLRQAKTSVKTNPHLPVTRNETGDREATDFTNICKDLNPETQADKTNAAVAASSLCTGDHGNAIEDPTGTEVGESRRGGEGSGPEAAADASLFTGEDVMDVNQLRRQLNIHPAQEFNGRSVQAEMESDPFLSSNIVQLRSTRTSDDLSSETIAKNTTQPKTIDDLPYHPPNAAAAAAAAGAESFSGEEDSEMRLSLQSDPPCQRIDDVNLRSSSASFRSRPSESDAGLSSDRTPQVALIIGKRLNHSQSVPEADAILSPETQRAAIQLQPSFSTEENKQPSSSNDGTLRAEEERNSNWNTGNSGSDYNLDVSQGYYPKGGGSFQRHVHPDVNQRPSPDQPLGGQHLFQPTVPSGPQWGTRPTGPTGFTANQAGGYNIPPPTNQPLPTSIESRPLYTRTKEDAATWNSLNRDSKPSQQTKSKSREPSTIIVKNDDQEITVIHSTGSGIQIGNNNTMIINGRGSARQKVDSRLPPPSSSSLSSSAAGPAAVKAPKATVTKKIIVPKRVVDQESILMVADNIGKDWKPLARHLGFQEPDIDSFNIDFHQLGVREVAYQMLRDWRERRGPEATMQALAKALVDIKRPDIALKLATKSPANSET